MYKHNNTTIYWHAPPQQNPYALVPSAKLRLKRIKRHDLIENYEPEEVRFDIWVNGMYYGFPILTHTILMAEGDVINAPTELAFNPEIKVPIPALTEKLQVVVEVNGHVQGDTQSITSVQGGRNGRNLKNMAQGAEVLFLEEKFFLKVPIVNP